MRIFPKPQHLTGKVCVTPAEQRNEEISTHYASTRKVKTPENTRVIPMPKTPDPMIGIIQWTEENLRIIKTWSVIKAFITYSVQPNQNSPTVTSGAPKTALWHC